MNFALIQTKVTLFSYFQKLVTFNNNNCSSHGACEKSIPYGYDTKLAITYKIMNQLGFQPNFKKIIFLIYDTLRK